MHDENGREYVDATAIPSWMASALGKLVPVVLISALGSSLFLWRDVALLRADLAGLKQAYSEFAVECIRRRQQTDRDSQRLADCIRRVERIEDRVSQ